ETCGDRWPSATEPEVDRHADATRGGPAVDDRRVEAPPAGRLHRGAVEVAVAAGLLDRHVGDVAARIDVDDQDHRALDAGTRRGGRVLRRVHVLGRDVDAGADVRLR